MTAKIFTSRPKPPWIIALDGLWCTQKLLIYPATPQKRHDTLAEAFCRRVLKEFHPKLHPSSYDHIHIPADFDSEQPLKRWFIIDLNVKEPLTTESVTQIPHLVYLASHQDKDWKFIERENWKQKAIIQAKSFTWGGRLEQSQVAEMRAEMRSENPAELFLAFACKPAFVS